MKLDEVKRQGELVAEIGKARAGGEDPGCDRGYGGEHDGEAGDGVEHGEDQDLRTDAQHNAAKKGAREAQQLLLP